eukprot:15992441-Heterocapsa_arctica.AAC.1
MIGNKRATLCGYGDVSKGRACALRGTIARVIIIKRKPICALPRDDDLRAVPAEGDDVGTAPRRALRLAPPRRR